MLKKIFTVAKTVAKNPVAKSVVVTICLVLLTYPVIGNYAFIAFGYLASLLPARYIGEKHHES